jgi:hypothetical protein
MTHFPQEWQPNKSLQLTCGSRALWYPWNGCLRLPQAAEF